MEAALMAALAFTNVTLWTVRVALMHRRAKRLASAVAASEAMLFAVGLSQIVGELTAVDRLLGYALGVAAGTWVGLTLDERVAARRPPAVAVDDDLAAEFPAAAREVQVG